MKTIISGCAIVGYTETRGVETERDSGSDKIVELKPIEGSERAFLDLRLPGGMIIRAEVDYGIFVAAIVPLMTAHEVL